MSKVPTDEPNDSPAASSPDKTDGGSSASATTLVRTAFRHGMVRGFWERCYHSAHTCLIEPLVLSRNPPWLDARGVSIGLIVGFLVPVGGQLVTIGLLRMALRFNVVVAAAFSFVSNPFNMIPLYYGYYCLGSYILGKHVTMNLHVFKRLLNPVMDSAYFWETWSEFMQLGCEFLVRWFVAAVVLSVVFGVLGYVVTLKVQDRRCRRAAKKLGMQYESFLEQLERNASAQSK